MNRRGRDEDGETERSLETGKRRGRRGSNESQREREREREWVRERKREVEEEEKRIAYDGQSRRYTFDRCTRLKRITFDISIGQSGFLLDIRLGIIADACRKTLRVASVIKLYHN